MTSYNEKFCRQPSYRIYSWFFAVTVFYLLLTLFLPGQFYADPLSLAEREQFEFAIKYLQQNGHTKEAEQFRNLLQKGHIETKDLKAGTNAETLDGRITFQRDLFTGRTIQDPESLNRFSMASTLAQVILHELKHVDQSGWEIGTSNVLDLVSDNPAELEGWGKAMQSTLDSIIRLEGALATAEGKEQRLLVEKILILRIDLITSYNGLRDAGYGEVSLRGPEGRQLNETAVRRYLEAVNQQAEDIKAGRQPEPGTRATARDKRELDQDLIVRFQRQWDALEREKDDILAAMSQPEAQKGLDELFNEIKSMCYDIRDFTYSFIHMRTLCTELGTNVDKLVRFSMASKGAIASLQNDLDSALGIECNDNSELSRINTLFDSASKHAANIQQLFRNSVLAHDSHQRLMRIFEGRPIINSEILATLMNLDNIQDVYSNLLKSVDEFNRLSKTKIDLLDRRDAYLVKRSQFRQSVESEKKQVPELLQLFKLANQPIREIWPIIISRTKISDDQFKTKLGLRKAEQEFDSLPHGQAPPSFDCINTAIVEQAFADVQEANAWSILKLAALDEHKNKCRAALAQTPTDIDAGGLRIKGPAKIEAGTDAFYKATDGAGNDYNNDINWSVSSDELVAIGLEGRIRALKPGRFFILAKKNELQADMEVSIFAILPDLRGKTAQNAVDLLKEMNIKTSQALGVPSESEDQAGKVQKTIPEPGTEIIDQTVSVVLYTSPNSVDGGFEDEADGNGSDSGFSDESDSEGENTKGLTQEEPDWNRRKEAEKKAINDQRDAKEEVTYFDRQWMPRSWSTSGDSHEVIVNEFEAASRLGWAEALALYTNGQADVEISQHLYAAGEHIKKINQNSFGPHKALQDWKQRQAKLISLAQKITQQNMERRNSHRKGLPNAIKSEARSLLKALSYQGAGSVEQMENCDSHYFRIGYHTAYAAQALAAAEAGAEAGGSQAWIRKVTGRANSHAAAARGALQDLRKMGVASGACVDMASIEPMINKAAQGTAFRIEKAQSAEQAWHAEFSALKDGGRDECGGELEGTWRNMEGRGYLISWKKNGDSYEGRYLNSLRQAQGIMEGQLFAVYKKTGSRTYKVIREIKGGNYNITVAGNFYSDSDKFTAITTFKRVSQMELSQLQKTKPNWAGQRFWVLPGEKSYGPHDEMPNCSKKNEAR